MRREVCAVGHKRFGRKCTQIYLDPVELNIFMIHDGVAAMRGNVVTRRRSQKWDTAAKTKLD